MGRFKDKYKRASEVVSNKVDELRTIEPGPVDDDDFEGMEDERDGFDDKEGKNNFVRHNKG